MNNIMINFVNSFIDNKNINYIFFQRSNDILIEVKNVIITF